MNAISFNNKRLFIFTLFFLSIYSIASFAQQTKTYQGIVEIGGGVSPIYGGLGFIKADFIYGIKYNDHFSMGLGAGVRAFPEEFTLFLLYGNFRANLGYNKCGNVYPFIQNRIGFAFFGFTNNLSIGLGFKNSPFFINISGETIINVIGFSHAYVPISLNIGFTF